MALRGCLTERNLTQFQLWAEHKEYSRYYAGFDHFYSAYHPIHGPLSTALASIGVLMNLANIVVLTRPSLINVVNVILTAMSLCDIGLDLSYLLYLAHFVLSKADYHRDFYCDPSQNTWGWAVFQLFHAHFSTISHATTLWLAVGMAGMRHFILSRPHPVANTSTRLLPGLLVIFLTAALVVLSSVPHLLLYRISPVPYELSGCPDLESENETAWRATVQRYIESKTVVWGVEMWENRCAVRIFSFWISGLCYKILPCAMLSVFMGLLISTVLKARERRRKVVGDRGSSQQSDQTTTMLILIVSVFLLSELPQGLLTVLSGVLNSHFYDHVYKGLGDFLDLLSLLNSLVTFILYCSMSGMYRKTFCQVFLIDRIRSLWSLLRTRWTSLQWRRRLVTSEDPLETSTLSPIKMPELFELVQTCPTNGLSTEAEFL